MILNDSYADCPAAIIPLRGSQAALTEIVKRVQRTKAVKKPNGMLFHLELDVLQYEGEPFVLHDYQTSTQKYILLGSILGPRIPTSAKTFIVDGTYFSAPRGFDNVYGFHAAPINTREILPCLHVLMSHKSAAIISQFMEGIKQEALVRLGITWKPTNMVCDFDAEQVKAAKTTFKDIKINYCLHHFVALIFKYFRSSKLLRLLVFDTTAAEIYNCFRALSFLPQFLRLFSILMHGLENILI